MCPLETRRCEFESRLRERIFRYSLQCQINMNLVFHISEDGSEIELSTVGYTYIVMYHSSVRFVDPKEG